jgi:signal transduction histidine kinase
MLNLPSAPRRSPASASVDPLFAGVGEMRARCRALDWSTTPLGPTATWPVSLRTTIATLLASRHPMFLWWGSTLTQVYNDAYLPSFGQGARGQAALGMAGAECWTEIWEVIGPQISQVLAGGNSTWHENQLVPIERNGQLEDVWWTYSFGPAFDDCGAVHGVLVVCHETTHHVRAAAERERLIIAEQIARAETEAMRDSMKIIFAQAPVAVAVLEGRELRYAMANSRYQAIIGNRDPVGKTLIEMFPDLSGSDIVRVLERVYDNAVPFVARDLLIRFDSSGDGPNDHYYDLVYHPLTLAEGKVSGIVVVAVDVTDRRRNVLEAVQAKADAERANRAKSDFLAVMSHELRTPLNAIGGYAELLDLEIRGPITAEQREDLARIKKSQQHLLSVVTSVLDYARLERGQIELRPRNVLLNDAMSLCKVLVAPQAAARGLTLELEECAGDAFVFADTDKLHQILLNVLANAIKFSVAGGVVSMSCEISDAAARLSVRDTGRGIASDQLERIFEPFVQVDSGLGRSQDGIGLGLAISRELARRMGGDLTVQSEPERGSTFVLTLPRAGVPSIVSIAGLWNDVGCPDQRRPMACERTTISSQS